MTSLSPTFAIIASSPSGTALRRHRPADGRASGLLSEQTNGVAVRIGEHGEGADRSDRHRPEDRVAAELLGASEVLVEVVDAHIEGHVRRHLGRRLHDAAPDADLGPRVDTPYSRSGPS